MLALNDITSWIESSRTRCGNGFYGCLSRDDLGSHGSAGTNITQDDRIAAGWAIDGGNPYEISFYEHNGSFVLAAGRCYDSSSASDCAHAVWLTYLSGGIDAVATSDLDASIALWDTTAQRLHLLRDRSGVQRLYVHQQDNALWFSTQIRAVIDRSPRRFDEASLALFLVYGLGGGIHSIYEGVGQIPLGASITWTADSFASGRHWQDNLTYDWHIESRDPVTSESEALDQLEAAISKALYKFTKHESKVGVLLSGGIDSVAIWSRLQQSSHGSTFGAHVRAANDSSYIGHRKDDACVDLLNRQGPSQNNMLHVSREESAEELYDEWRSLSMLSADYSPWTAVFYKACAKKLLDHIPRGSVVFTGEFNLLDMGMSETSDRTGSLKRWLYSPSATWLPRFPVSPFVFLDGLNYGIARSLSSYHGYRRMDYMLSLLSCLGRPSHYYGGRLFGTHGLPGVHAGKKLQLNAWKEGLQTVVVKQCLADFISPHINDMTKASQRASLYRAELQAYNESSNLQMAQDACASVGLRCIHPYNDPHLAATCTAISSTLAARKDVLRTLCETRWHVPSSVTRTYKDHSGSHKAERLAYLLPTVRKAQTALKNPAFLDHFEALGFDLSIPRASICTFQQNGLLTTDVSRYLCLHWWAEALLK